MRSPRTPGKEGKRGREGRRGRTLAAARGVAAGRNFCDDNHEGKGEGEEEGRSVIEAQVGRCVGGPHTTGVERGSRSEENNFIISPTDATGFVCSLAAGSYPTHFFPLTRTRQKTLLRVIVSRCPSSSALCGRCGTDRSLLCLRISCEWVEYLTSGALAVAGFRFSPSAGRQRAALPVAPSITFSPSRLKRLSAFRLLIRLHSRARWSCKGREAICFSRRKMISASP